MEGSTEARDFPEPNSMFERCSHVLAELADQGGVMAAMYVIHHHWERVSNSQILLIPVVKRAIY